MWWLFLFSDINVNDILYKSEVTIMNKIVLSKILIHIIANLIE